LHATSGSKFVPFATSEQVRRYNCFARHPVESSKLAVFVALAANLIITVTKFIVAVLSGSSAMVSEGIHSAVDCLNQILLLYGIKASKKPATSNRPFGYGKELYFWSFIVAILIFGLGGGISLYEGISHVYRPRPLGNPFWNYIVLSISFLFDGISFVVSLRAFNKHRGKKPFWLAVKQSKDPSTFVIVFEDFADLLGLIIAFSGIYLSQLLHNDYFDGAASILIGLTLGTVSMILAKESKSLLVGEPSDSEIITSVKSIVNANPGVVSVKKILSTILGPSQSMLIIEAFFKQDLRSEELVTVTNRIRKDIQIKYPHFTKIIFDFI
jgi:cation diffusion facilitator family transporter